MRKLCIYFIAVAMLLPMTVIAQTEEKLDAEFGGRFSAGIDKKIVKGLHVFVEEEVRMDDNFRSFGRFQTTIGVSYKVHNNIKLGVGYALINPYDSDDKAFKFRHRIYADITGTLHLGQWNISLKERFLMTHRSGDFNVYQDPANALTLKSRLTFKYKGFGRFVPYAFVEIRSYHNAPVVSAAYDGSGYLPIPDSDQNSDTPGWFLQGFKGAYINRVRSSLGIDVKLSKQHTLNVYFLADYVRDKVLDANAEGTKLKSYTKQTGFVGSVGVGYEFSF
ncbi:MAG: DUF2490 domain-containing protein [Bacteroidales bacterium]|nr:DUF2490 domain-containing protein [Bacteroidales bacterium]